MKRIILALLERLPVTSLQKLVTHMIGVIVARLPAEQALKYLLSLDEWLYAHQGQQAINYGDGLHVKHRVMRYHEFFVSRVKPGESIIDVGCGAGAVAYDLATKGDAMVTAIDSHQGQIEEARRVRAHQNITYISGDVLADLPEGTFDTAVLSNILEHLPHRVDFLKGLRDKTGFSRVLIRVPLYERDWRVPVKQELGLEWRLDPTHETEYTLETFADEMAGANLDVTHQEVRWGEIWAEAVNRG